MIRAALLSLALAFASPVLAAGDPAADIAAATDRVAAAGQGLDAASAAAAIAGWDILPSNQDISELATSAGRRIREESIEEQMVRRRRREATVVSQGTGSFGQMDVPPPGDENDGPNSIERVVEALAIEMGRQEARQV